MGLATTESPSVYRLILGKRGSRAGWRDAAGTPTIERYLAHAKESDRIYWREASKDEREEVGGAHIPTEQELVNILRDGSMKKKELIDAILKIGGKRSYAYKLIARAISDNIIRENPDGFKITGKIRPSISVEDTYEE